ncbi:MAG: hypothetical protein ACHQRM_10400 [Bacteroidia bacterium]
MLLLLQRSRQINLIQRFYNLQPLFQVFFEFCAGFSGVEVLSDQPINNGLITALYFPVIFRGNHFIQHHLLGIVQPLPVFIDFLLHLFLADLLFVRIGVKNFPDYFLIQFLNFFFENKDLEKIYKTIIHWKSFYPFLAAFHAMVVIAFRSAPSSGGASG